MIAEKYKVLKYISDKNINLDVEYKKLLRDQLNLFDRLSREDCMSELNYFIQSCLLFGSVESRFIDLLYDREFVHECSRVLEDPEEYFADTSDILFKWLNYEQ